ncbi:MAG: dicarboxylate/amino acid:cation symporter, partial [Desulfovibrio sp.]|nr:dicarboxylate/amino acid:cation symporter [Desulfovibrio sp.]
MGRKMSLATKIFIALILGIVAGLLLQNSVAFANGYIKPFGTIFLNLIKFIVCPVVLFSIIAGMITLSDVRQVSTIGAKTVCYFIVTTFFAITIGLIGGFLFKGLFP